jgi:hypothetical protein
MCVEEARKRIEKNRLKTRLELEHIERNIVLLSLPEKKQSFPGRHCEER